ncbi:MAG: histidine kinase [Bacteroidota bacterium]
MLVHVIFWLTIYLVWTYIRSNGERDTLFFQINLVELALYMMAYYVLKHWQIPQLFDTGKSLLFCWSILGTSIFLYFLWRIAGVLYLDDLRGYTNARFVSLSGYLSQSVQVYSPAVILLAWESYHDRQKELERIELLEKEKIATELQFLKAQINPHFLFNTLNNLYSNVINKSPQAPKMVMQLSGILDYILYQSQNKTVPLSEEVQTIDNFLGLEKIRYGARLAVEYHADQNSSLPVSPLILLSIVENAFKHGASGDIDGPKIKINIKAANGIIHCEVWNTKSKYSGNMTDAYKEGIGLSNIKRQLDLIYPQRHQLIIEDGENSFKVLLTIQALAT